MNEISGKARTVRELLKGIKYSIDYYQREYKWQEKQIKELIEDLTGKFLEEFDISHSRSKVADYPHYFLGSIIISKKENSQYIVDGQQRLTSLTLLLIYLRNLQKDRTDSVNVDELIFSEKYGVKSFNLDVDERISCMNKLFDGQFVEANGETESVNNLIRRFHDVESNFPDELRGDALPYFLDWLLENVHLVEITAYSDDDAYTIFETMNDRGLSLSPTEMLKGYLLANIETKDRISANDMWKKRIQEFNNIDKDTGADFFKAWLRSQYSTKIRERKKNANPEDFDRIGTEFHRWLRDVSDNIGLKESADFLNFIEVNFNFFSKQYLRILEASNQIIPGLEYVLFNAQLGFTLQPMLLLAPLKVTDSEAIVKHKMNLVAHFLDILLNWRLWNFRLIAYSTMQYAMFLVMREIRSLDVEQLSVKLRENLQKETETFASNDRLKVHQQNRYMIHRILARITDYIEVQSENHTHYLEYVSEGNARYEVEHIWSDHAEDHLDEFAHPADFGEYRNRIGGLLLLPKKFNASYGDLPYNNKLPLYDSQNLLARSLHVNCYQHNPGFVRFISETGLPFKTCPEFSKKEIEERSLLYRLIAERVWNPNDLVE
ncbi:MAG: DUF262 domain-containing protein [Anaerolineaceae bacterium]